MALSTHSGVAKVQEAGCGAFGNLVTYYSAAIAAAGGIGAIVVALSTHPGVAKVQELGCMVLWLFARFSPEHKETIKGHGGIALADEAIRLHSGNACVTTKAFVLKAALEDDGGLNQPAP